MTDRRMFPPGAPLSPTGWVVMGPCGRRPVIGYVVPGGTCTWCGDAAKPPRRTWCSQGCVDQFKRRTPAAYRSRVLQTNRDDPRTEGRCVLCNERRATDVDHRQPIIEGGDPFDDQNLRALCSPCHDVETRGLAYRRADSPTPRYQCAGCGRYIRATLAGLLRAHNQRGWRKIPCPGAGKPIDPERVDPCFPGGST